MAFNSGLSNAGPDLDALIAQVNTGDLTPHDRVDAHLQAIADCDDPHIFIDIADRDRLLAAVDPGLPLAGLTFAAKNNIDVAGFVTTAGCPSYGYQPDRSAAVVAQLQAAGASCLGVTNLDQFATGLVGTRSPYGVPTNACSSELIPGGSSSGSAVAVARGLVDFALGTDTAGSGRVPAAHNRIIGLKPSVGRLSTRGVVPAVQSLDCVSVFGRSIDATILAMLAGSAFDPHDPLQRHPGQTPAIGKVVRVGLPNKLPRFHTNADALAWHATLDLYATRRDVEIVSVNCEALFETADLLYGGPWVAQRYDAVGQFLDTEPADADPQVSQIVRAASAYSAVEAYRAQARLAELRTITDQLWSQVDVLLTPTTTGVATLAEVEADPIGRNTELGRFTNWVNLLDQCALAIPGVDRSDGLPFGVTLLAPAWSELALAGVASRLTMSETAPLTSLATRDTTDVVVVGAHLAGQPLNWQLTDHGGVFVRAATTTPEYRLFALGDSTPAKPALVHTGTARNGASIEVEVWRLPNDQVGTFLAYIPTPLGLGRVLLADGSAPTGFIAEPRALDTAEDVTHWGGWRAYRTSLET